MEFFFKVLVDLVEGLSSGGILALIVLGSLLIGFTIKATLKFSNVVKERERAEIDKDAQDKRDIIDEIKKLRDLINDSIDTTNKDSTESKSTEKKIESHAILIIEKLNEIKDEMDEKLNKNELRHEGIEIKLEKIKLDNDHIHQLLKEFGIEDRSNHQEIIRQIQSLIKDIAILQGTLIGNFNQARTTLSK